MRDDGSLIGVVTGALEAAAHIKLARGGLNGFFAFGGYGSDSANRGQVTRRAIDRASATVGQRIDRASVSVVGDTPNDIRAAHTAGAVAIGVASGHYTVEDLRSAGADATLKSLEDPIPGVERASEPPT